MPPPEICPHCGAPVPPRARACPECGSDEETGWSEEARYQNLGLSTEEFDYEAFVREEFGEPHEPTVRPRGIGWGWWLVAIVIAIALLLLSF